MEINMHGEILGFELVCEEVWMIMLVWLPAFLLAITCVSHVQMSNVSPFQTFTLQYLFNDINFFSRKWVLAPAIAP
jgi:hypothetical protein